MGAGREGRELSRGRDRSTLLWAAAVAGLAVATAGGNMAWTAANRRGLPFDIDEAGYLQRAVRDGDALGAHGPAALWTLLRLRDPEAPLVPMTAGLIRAVTGAGPYELLWSQSAFVVTLIAATFLAARTVTTRRWSMLAAFLVACVPAVVNEGRAFHFGLAAAALGTATLAFQMRAGGFRSLRASLLWGTTLGLASLTRTMMIGLLPVLVAAAAIKIVSDPGRRSVAHFGAGLGLGAAVAACWYSETWPTVWRYLTGYGFGPDASGYGRAHTVLGPSWWTFRTGLLVRTELFAPLAGGLALTAALVLLRPRRPRAPGDRPGGAPRMLVAAITASPCWTPAFFVVGSYVVLSSSRNTGLYFELPLVPPVIVLVVGALGRSAGRAVPVAAGVLVCVGTLSYAGTTGLLDGLGGSSPQVALGSTSFPIWNSRGSFAGYAGPTVATCPEPVCHGHRSGPQVDRYLARWPDANDHAAEVLHAYAAARGDAPVVFFAQQDRFFNTNTVDLAYELRFRQTLPTGVLEDPARARETLVRQLEDPARGRPNLVITGPRAPTGADFSPLLDVATGQAALVRSGFRAVAAIDLPDGRKMTVWWSEQRPVAEGP